MLFMLATVKAISISRLTTPDSNVSERTHLLAVSASRDKSADALFNRRTVPDINPWSAGLQKSTSISKGHLWQPRTDIYNDHYLTHIKNQSQLYTDEHGVISRTLHGEFGPLRLLDARWISYISYFRAGARYQSIENVLEWGVRPNYDELQRQGFTNLWADWNPNANLQIPTPWLRTSMWGFQGWSQTYRGHADITIFIYISSRTIRPADTAEQMRSSPLPPPD